MGTTVIIFLDPSWKKIKPDFKIINFLVFSRIWYNELKRDFFSVSSKLERAMVSLFSLNSMSENLRFASNSKYLYQLLHFAWPPSHQRPIWFKPRPSKHFHNKNKESRSLHLVWSQDSAGLRFASPIHIKPNRRLPI